MSMATAEPRRMSTARHDMSAARHDVNTVLHAVSGQAGVELDHGGVCKQQQGGVWRRKLAGGGHPREVRTGETRNAPLQSTSAILRARTGMLAVQARAAGRRYARTISRRVTRARLQATGRMPTASMAPCVTYLAVSYD